MEQPDMKIRINKEHFLHYMQHIPIGYMMINQAGIITAVNNVFLKATNYKEQDILHKSINNIIVSEKIEDIIDKLNLSTNDSFLKLVWRDVDGVTHNSKVSIYKFCSSNNSDIYYAISFLEIKKESSQSLLMRFTESFVSENNIGLIIIDKNTNIVEISPLACNLLNISKNQALNNKIDEVLSYTPDEHRIVQRALKDGITVTNYAITWEIAQNKYNLLIDSNVIKDENASVIGAYVVFKDVTNLRSLEQQVRQNDRLKTIGQIAAGTAHEIRNPLTSIKGFLQILDGNLAENSESQSYIRVMLSEIERINKLVTEILLLSKPKDVDYSPIDASVVIRELQAIISNEGILHGIDVNFHLDKSLPFIMADPKLLKQVVLNVAKNGIEAMGEGGKLTIETKKNIENRNIEILVHDTGPGIPNYIVDKVFEPFFTTKEEGTGLGLSICQKIVHDLGGNIRIASKGFGTTFQILLPYI